MRKACIVVSFAGFAAYTVSTVHSCLVNRRRKAPEVLEEDSGSSDNHARTEPLGHLHDKAELPSDSVARIYELHGHNVVEVGGRVLVTHELHSTPLAELPGDSKCWMYLAVLLPCRIFQDRSRAYCVYDGGDGTSAQLYINTGRLRNGSLERQQFLLIVTGLFDIELAEDGTGQHAFQLSATTSDIRWRSIKTIPTNHHPQHLNLIPAVSARGIIGLTALDKLARVETIPVTASALNSCQSKEHQTYNTTDLFYEPDGLSLEDRKLDQCTTFPSNSRSRWHCRIEGRCRLMPGTCSFVQREHCRIKLLAVFIDLVLRLLHTRRQKW